MKIGPILEGSSGSGIRIFKRQIKEWRNGIVVLGEVRLPSVIAWRTDMTLLGCLNACGGVTDHANPKDVVVVRKSRVVRVNMRAVNGIIIDGKFVRNGSFKMAPGDVVVFPTREDAETEPVGPAEVIANVQALTAGGLGTGHPAVKKAAAKLANFPGVFLETISAIEDDATRVLIANAAIDELMKRHSADEVIDWGVQNAWAISCGFSGNFELVLADFS